MRVVHQSKMHQSLEALPAAVRVQTDNIPVAFRFFKLSQNSRLRRGGRRRDSRRRGLYSDHGENGVKVILVSRVSNSVAPHRDRRGRPAPTSARTSSACDVVCLLHSRSFFWRGGVVMSMVGVPWSECITMDRGWGWGGVYGVPWPWYITMGRGWGSVQGWSDYDGFWKLEIDNLDW